MPHPPLSAAGTSPVLAVRPLRDAAVAVTAVVLALLALYAVFLDQGQLLSPVLGKLATSANYLHEFAHDGRHLLGAPCH
ncbi:CbtB-domain containing protein [Streptomyces sp. NPDC052727]|uniref:CbtB domain-containing protein n=1 Tax=unclassified Streptomyces TaxID=2593676 RepID=UPI00341DC2FC